MAGIVTYIKHSYIKSSFPIFMQIFERNLQFNVCILLICGNVHVQYTFYDVACMIFPSIQDPVTMSEDCLNGQDIRANYELSYTSDCGSLITTCVVDGTECTNGNCRHQLQNNTVDSRCQSPVSQFSGEGVTVSVTARNIVGRSNPAVSRSISEFEGYNL